MPRFFGFYTLVSCRLPWLILHHPLLITGDHGGAANPDGRSVVIGIIYLARRRRHGLLPPSDPRGPSVYVHCGRISS